MSKGASVAKGAGSKLLGAGKFLKGTGKLLPGIGTALTVGAGALDAAGAYSDYEEGKITEQERNSQMGKGGGAAAGALTGAAIGSMFPVVGTAIGGLAGAAIGYGGGSYFGGMFGSDQKKGAVPKVVLPPEDAAKSAAADVKAATEYQKASPEEKAKIQETTGATDKELNAASSKLLKNKSFDARTQQLADKKERLKQTVATVDTPEAKELKKQLRKDFAAESPTPPPTATNQPLRNMQTAALEQSTATVNDAKLQPPIAKEMAKSVNSTNVINNNTNTTVVRPEVRTAEPSFNRVLANNFSF